MGSRLVTPEAPAGLLAAAAPAAPLAEWPARRYLLVMAVVAIPSAFIMAAGFLLGQPWVAGVIVAVPVGLLILWKPEIGLYLLVLYIPFEYYAVIGAGLATLTKIGGFFTAAAVLVHLRGRRVGHIWSGAWLMAVAFTGWCLVTTIGARSQELAWLYMATRVQMIGLMFVTLLACDDLERARTFFWALFAASVLAAVGGFFLTPAPETAYEVARATIGGQNVNEHARNLLPGIVFVPFLLRQGRRWLRLLVLAGALVVVIGLVQTASRSIFVAVYAGVAVGLLCYRGMPWPRRVGLLVLITGLLVAVAAFGTATGLFEVGIWERFVALREKGLTTGGRIYLWLAALKLAAQHPLMGVGVGNYRLAVMAMGLAPAATHNDFLTHFAETGVPGILLYLAFLVLVLRNAWRVPDGGLRASVMGLFVAAVVASMANPSYVGKSFWLQVSACILADLALRPHPGGGAEATPEPAPNLAVSPSAGG